MRDCLSVWRSPLDHVAISSAVALNAAQPQCSIVYQEDLSPITVYNYGNFVHAAAGVPGTALTNMLNTMQSPASLPYGTTGIGGTAFVPQGQFPINSSSTGFPVPDQVNIVGSGGGGESDGGGAPDFFHWVITPPSGASAATYFFYCSGTHTPGGQYFRGLAFDWGATSYEDVCIYANTWNCRAITCTFTDCPVAFSAQGESCGLESCTIQWTKNYAGPTGSGASGPGAFGVIALGGAQCYAVGPAEFLHPSQTGDTGDGSCCISLQSGLEHGVVRDLHVSDWSYGLSYALSSSATINNCMITNCEFSCFVTCVYIEPSNDSGIIYDQKFTDCAFWLTTNSGTSESLIYVNAAGGVVSDIEFIGCTVYQSSLHGYEIHGGSNIKIIGGTSAGNGSSGGAGIALTGAGGGHIFQGVNLDASYPQASMAHNQQYAFLCTGDPTSPVFVDGCSMQGYGTASPVHVSGSPSTLVIQNCLGYNDQLTPIAPSAPTASAGISAATASSITGGVNYYGPSLVVFTAGGSSIIFTVNGVASTIPANAFFTCYLSSPYDLIRFHPSGDLSGSSFSWIGK
jgi:hypothetical protein